MDLRSPLGKVKGLGSAKSGSHHWWMQRVTALGLIPLVIWFVSLVICAAKKPETIVDLLQSPLNSVAAILFIGVALYHGALGMRVIIEDYVHCSCGRPFLIIMLNFVTIVTAVASILALIYLHTGAGDRHHKKKWNKSGYMQVDKKEHRKWRKDFYDRLRQEQEKVGE